MSVIKILGIDPSLRNTGLAVVSYDTSMDINDPEAFSVDHCQVVCTPQKYKKKDAILCMIYLLKLEAAKKCYQDFESVLIELPAVLFNQQWSASTIGSIAPIAGAAVAYFGVEKTYLFKPTEWNRGCKKSVTHAMAQDFLGDCTKWNFEKEIKSRICPEKYYEHIIDAASLALWWIKTSR